MADKSATPDSGATRLPAHGSEPASTDPDSTRSRELVQALETYRFEADNARKGGLNPRDQKWEENLNLYWNRTDFSKKKDWQAKETMPEVPQYVDRFAAAMKEALVAGNDGFYTVVDPADTENDISGSLKRMMDVWLSRVSRTQTGQLLPFSAVFEEQMKLGAMMACSMIVTWKGDVPGGRVAMETVDPRQVWLDPTYRNLYRIRRIELDRHDLMKMAKEMDGKGKPIYNLPEMHRLMSGLWAKDLADKEAASGHGQQISSGRSPITLDEYIATVVNAQGEVIADRSLMVVANQDCLVRGPEVNPFMHETDWLVYSPLITAPNSVYGRSYMEDFAGVASTFQELTNMLLDAVHTSALKIFAIVPSMLINPEQAMQGIRPNMTFLVEDGFNAKDFGAALDMGTLSPDAVRMWESMKKELSEAAGINEIGLGQFAPKGRTSATEINQTQQSSSALIRSVAQTVEMRVLDPALDLGWKTGLQHARADDKLLQAAAGPELYAALIGRRKELIQRPLTFQARGISQLIRKSNMLKSYMGILQLISSNDMLMQEFLKVVDPDKFLIKLFELSDIDLTKLQRTKREDLMQSIANPMQQLAAQGGPAGQGQAPGEMQQVAQSMGVAR